MHSLNRSDTSDHAIRARLVSWTSEQTNINWAVFEIREECGLPRDLQSHAGVQKYWSSGYVYSLRVRSPRLAMIATMPTVKWVLAHGADTMIGRDFDITIDSQKNNVLMLRSIDMCLLDFVG